MKSAAGPAAQPSIVRLGVVPSTQGVAFDLAARGAPDRTVVVADHQTAGRGRRGRRWEDEPGANLLVSIVVRSRLPASELPRMGFAAALAVAEALEEVAGVAPRLKWPNDVLVGGRKIAGILVESRAAPGAASTLPAEPTGLADQGPVAVIGIGVNLGQRRFPPALTGHATSVALETETAGDREALLASLLRALDSWRARLERDGFEPLRERWLALADTIGRDVRIEGLTGRAVGLAPDGALLVQEGRTVHRVVAGTIGPAGDI